MVDYMSNGGVPRNMLCGLYNLCNMKIAWSTNVLIMRVNPMDTISSSTIPSFV